MRGLSVVQSIIEAMFLFVFGPRAFVSVRDMNWISWHRLDRGERGSSWV